MAQQDVIKYPIKPLQLAIGGGFMALVTVPFVLIAAWRTYMVVMVDDARAFYFVDLIIILGLITCGGLALFALGLAIQRPIGLRIDAKGISGYVAPSLAWEEISDVDVADFHRGHGVVLKMRDPMVFLKRQSGWRKVLYQLGGGRQIMVNTTYLRVQPEQIAKDIKAHLARSKSSMPATTA